MEQNAVNWWVTLAPVFVSVGIGTIFGSFLSTWYKSQIDKQHAIAQRQRDHHLSRSDTIRKVIAAVVGARSAASEARHADQNKTSNIEEIAVRSRATRESHVQNFNRLSDVALVEAERFGLVPEWSSLPDRSLSTYVEFVLQGRLGFALDADSYQYGQSADAYGHASALIRDLRSLVDTEEALAQDAFITSRKAKTFRIPALPYLNELKVYFKGDEVDVRKLDMSVLESRMAQEEWEKKERLERRAASKSVSKAQASAEAVQTK